jgi:hypothetical protein
MEALLVNLPLYFPPRFPFDFFHSQNAVASQSAHDGQVTDTNVTSCEATLRRQQTERPGVAFASSAFCILLSPSIRSVYTLFQRFVPSRKRQARRTPMLQSERQTLVNGSLQVFGDLDRQFHLRFPFYITWGAENVDTLERSSDGGTEKVFLSVSICLSRDALGCVSMH